MIIPPYELADSLTLIAENDKIANIDETKKIHPDFFAGIEHQHTRHQSYESYQVQQNSLYHYRNI
jgi:hypothetical protein